VVMDATPLEAPRERSMSELLKVGADLKRRNPLEFRTRTHQVAPDDVATIIYTSGTTGEPKGVMLTHANILSNVDACLTLVDLGPGDTALSFLPLCHIFERMGGMYAMLRAGARIAYARSIDSVAEDVVEVKPTLLMGVPRFYEKVHARVIKNVATRSWLERRLFEWGLARGTERARDHFAGIERSGWELRLADQLVLRKVRERMGGHLRVCISGGAALAPDTMEFFFAIGVPVLEGYGLTETSPVICLNRPGHEQPGSVGPPVPGVEVKIDEATRQALRDGWFHTGDIGHLDGGGCLHITDRLKDLIVLAGGKKVAPQPIEAKLKQSPLVSEAVLLGDKHPFVVCLIAPNFAAVEAAARSRGVSVPARGSLSDPGVRKLFEEEISAVNATLAPFETIKRFALLDTELSQENGALTATLKVKRKVVAERYAPVIDMLYSGHETPHGR
jgi:long-chain acyl-CoA synthetase